jgi:type III secretion protein J
MKKFDFSRLALICFVALLLCGCQVQLFDSLTEGEANEIMAALLDNGIEVEKMAGEEGTWIVMVDQQYFSDSVRLLDSLGLPPKKHEKMGEIFKKEGILSSPLEEKVRYVYALQEELSQTLCQIDGVLVARVHIVLPESNELGEKINPASVSIFIKYNENSDIDINSRIGDIKQLVGNSIKEIAYDKIHVSLFPASLKTIRPVGTKSGKFENVLGIKVAPGYTAIVWILIGIIPALLIGGGLGIYFVSRKKGDAEGDNS